MDDPDKTDVGIGIAKSAIKYSDNNYKWNGSRYKDYWNSGNQVIVVNNSCMCQCTSTWGQHAKYGAGMTMRDLWDSGHHEHVHGSRVVLLFVWPS